MAPLPVLKIFAVLFKEITKPLAASLKRRAQEHPHLREAAMALGRGYEHSMQRVDVLFSGKGRIKPGSFKPIPEGHALAVGADLLSQGFLLTTAIGLVLFEYDRGQRKAERDKEAKDAAKAQRRAVKEAQLRALEREVADVCNRVVVLELQLAHALGAIPRQRARAADQRDGGGEPNTDGDGEHGEAGTDGDSGAGSAP